MYHAGGNRLLAQRCDRQAICKRDCHTAYANTIGEEAALAQGNCRDSRWFVRTPNPIKPHGGFAILKGNLAPEGCVVKLAGHDTLNHRGPARVFDCEEAAFAAVQSDAISGRAT